MEKASEALEFEKAAAFRDKILAINTLVEKQKIFKVSEGDEDFINIYKDKKYTYWKKTIIIKIANICN